MAFDIDYTPLGAVGNLAARAGRNQAQRTDTQSMIQMHGQNLVDARARDELRVRKQQSDRGFTLQLAASERQNRVLDMRADQQKAGDERFQEARKARDENLADWESIRDQLQPDEYTRGLLSIRAGKVPQQLSSTRMKMRTFDDDLDRLRKLQMAASSYGKELEGFYLDKDGTTWRETHGGWGNFDADVKDQQKIARLNEANSAMSDIRQMRQIASDQFEAKTDQMMSDPMLSNADKTKRQLQQAIGSMSAPDQEKAYQLIQMVGPDEFLRMKAEAERAEEAQQRNTSTHGRNSTQMRRYGGGML